ncbi:GNAT family N-acetyltransferase [Deinococcus aquiradiocola]|uniref:N-acetyltransferase GCN5 n=1 Tax=Deinococcus aquiradiocola TaxID=393059 RepID=A0A917PEX5_9DEIO|nr:GNAT family N-acetyltransferase [Deinococcus aquiradiocola]GGJ73222.1 N-acetyltransferase GCN5 [Deinococcus aquiradiocola]
MTSSGADLAALPTLGASADGRYVVLPSQAWMADGLAEVQRACFPDLSEAELMTAAHFRAHLQVFPEGQHAVWDTHAGRVVASSTDLRLNVDFARYAHPYMEEVGHNTLSTHDPHGEWLYGADIGVHPDARGQGLSTLLYAARQSLVRQLGLRGHVAGAMPKGYGRHAHRMPIEEYVHRVILNELQDPVLSVQLRRHYRVWGVIPEYLEDASCRNYGVFIVWRNPERGGEA